MQFNGIVNNSGDDRTQLEYEIIPSECASSKCLLQICLPSGQDLQSEVRVPGALSNATKEPFGHFLQLVPT